jgi:flagellar motor switch protein FliN/FliY
VTTQIQTQDIETLGGTQSDPRAWLLSEFGAQVAAAVEGLTGDKQQVESVPYASRPSDDGLLWRQPFNVLPGAMWVVAADESWKNAGATVLRAAGIEETPDQLRSEYLEIIRQTAAGVARVISDKMGCEVAMGVGEQTHAIGEAQWGVISMTLGDVVTNIAVGFEPLLLAAIAGDSPREPPAQTASKTQERSKTFDLLLDLELPVSISFGRAQVPLKDVLKLTVGSIVELNRMVGDPVEVIVNNCVIARGQVVVVEGNFGVRIQTVISTQDRLRSLD